MLSIEEEIQKMKKDAEEVERARKVGGLTFEGQVYADGTYGEKVESEGRSLYSSNVSLMGHKSGEEDLEEASRYMKKQQLKQSNIFSSTQSSTSKFPYN